MIPTVGVVRLLACRQHKEDMRTVEQARPDRIRTQAQMPRGGFGRGDVLPWRRCATGVVVRHRESLGLQIARTRVASGRKQTRQTPIMMFITASQQVRISIADSLLVVCEFLVAFRKHCSVD